MENRPHPPLCDQCKGNHELTVKHILIEFGFLKIIRRRHYDVTDLNQLCKTVSSKTILDFVKDIGASRNACLHTDLLFFDSAYKCLKCYYVQFLSALQGCVFLFWLFIIHPWFYLDVKYCLNVICFTCFIVVSNISYNVLS